MRKVLLLLCLLYAGSVWAAEGPVASAPVYNPNSKSYFQLFSDNQHPGSWGGAKTRAEMKSFKGVRGRLAVIDSAETHDFVLRTFKLTQNKFQVWIGLRYWCIAHLLQWESGPAFSPTDPGHFKIWHTKWSRNSENDCSFAASKVAGFVPVYYVTIGNLTRWQAVGAAKNFEHYLVEYPTGKP
jgi:hypothetical protein